MYHTRILRRLQDHGNHPSDHHLVQGHGFGSALLSRRLFDQTVNEVRQAFADVPPDELQNMIDEAVVSVRKEKHQERQGRTRK